MSVTEQRIIKAMKGRAGTAKELAERIPCGHRTALTIINKLYADRQVRIVGWRRGSSGPITAVYGFGPGVDIERPAPLPVADICRRYRTRLRDKFGEHYGKIHEAQKHHIPGRKVVIDGVTVYQQ